MRRLRCLTQAEFQMLSYLSYDSEMSMSDFVRQLIRKEHERDRAASARLRAATEVLDAAERFVASGRA